MYYPNGPTTVPVMPTPLAPGVPGYYSDVGEGTIVSADQMNGLTMEVLNVIKASGQTPSHTDFTQLLKAIRSLSPNETSTLVTSSVTLASNSGIVTVSATNAPIVITLPPCTSSTQPLRIHFVRVDTTDQPVTIQRQGTDMIRTLTAVNLPRQADLTLHGDGVSTWWLARQGLNIGEVRAFAGQTLPPGWIYPNGANVSRSTYSALFAEIGTTWGAGNGSTTFTLPDLRGRAIFGKDDMGGVAAGRITAGVSGITGAALGASGGSEAMQGHSHGLSDPGHAHGATTGVAGSHVHDGWTSANGSHAHGGSTTANGVHNHPGSTSGEGGHAHELGYRGSNVTRDTVSQDGAELSQVGGGANKYTGTDGFHAHTLYIELAGEHTHSIGTDAAPNHTHAVGTAAAGDHGHDVTVYAAGTGISIAANGGGASQNMPPAMILNLGIYAGA